MTRGAFLNILSGCRDPSLLGRAACGAIRPLHQNGHRAPFPIVALLVVVCLSCVRGSAIQDPFASVPNAFRSTGTVVRAVYEAKQLTSACFTPGDWKPLLSSSYILCEANGGSVSGNAAINTSTALDPIVQAWCPSHSKGILVNQSVHWSTLAPPGLQLRDSSLASSRARSWDCLTYSCDMENTIMAHAAVSMPRSSIDAAYAALPPAVGGLGASTPCCGSTNSTFVLYMTRGLLAQSAALPVTAMNNEAAALYRAYVDEESTHNALIEGSDKSSGRGALRSSKSASTAPVASTAPRAEAVAASDFAAAPSRSREMDFCLVRQLSPSFYPGGTHSGLGDGGVVFATNASICSVDVSDRIRKEDATLIMRGYTAILTTAEGVEGLSFPKELIVAIASWIASPQNRSLGHYHSGQSLLREKGRCVWASNASYATAYRTGEYLECLFDPSALARLPPLVLSVRDESIVSTAETNNTCSIALQLSSCVSPGGKTLRFFSTGSIIDEIERHMHSMKSFREPAIVVGVQQLRGATVAATRHAKVVKWSTELSDAGHNQPLLYLAVPRGTAVAADVSALGALCVDSAVCSRHETFYRPLNLCAHVPCTRVLLYFFNADTFACSPHTAFVSSLAAICLTLVIAEGVVLYLRRKTESAKEEHMQLVLQVQRRSTEAQQRS
ncbi:hypothetical protein CUR178_06702 [Leishmania enriettii]|uniref:Uncharacterized protein n=1 Tax=Leishmania enriettii TaxID=5663 RepID=A0A836HTK3_LEIEN|nr:hypothetical protein CUR178_06702 [Leishmania enriettii]